MSEDSSSIDGDEVTVWSEHGRLLVAGEPDSIDRYLEQIEPQAQFDVSKLKNVADGVASLAAVRGTAAAGARYVQLTPESWAKLRTHGVVPDKAGAYHMFVRKDARMAGNLRWNPAPMSAARAVSLQTAAMSAALRLAIQEVQTQVEDVARDVADLKRIAESAEVGNLAGLYRVLANARDEVDTRGTMSQATWDSIAAHEVTAQQAADRVRSLLRSTVDGLPLHGDAGDRADAAERLVDEGTMRRSLRLLLLAEQCRLLWRSLKLDHVRKTEADALPAEIAAAERLLEENAAADRSLIELLGASVAQLGSLHALDGLRLMSRRKLPPLTTKLRTDLDEFAELRKSQIDSWVVGPAPTVWDATGELRKRAEQAAIEARQFTGQAFERFGRWLQGEPVRRDSESEPVAESRPEDDS